MFFLILLFASIGLFFIIAVEDLRRLIGVPDYNLNHLSILSVSVGSRSSCIVSHRSSDSLNHSFLRLMRFRINIL